MDILSKGNCSPSRNDEVFRCPHFLCPVSKYLVSKYLVSKYLVFKCLVLMSRARPLVRPLAFHNGVRRGPMDYHGLMD
jgi:hypothetical protein